MIRASLLTSLLLYTTLSIGQFNLEFNKVYGGNATDESKDIAINQSGTTLFFGGRSYSSDGDVPGNAGASDFWIMKRNLNGSLVWSRNFGGPSNDDLVAVMPHSDGGVVAFGTTHTSQGNFGTIMGLAGGWLMRTNSTGNLVNGKIFGGQITETAVDAVRAVNGNVTMLMEAASVNLNGQVNHGVLDVWVVNVNSNFDIQWSNLIGGPNADIPTAIAQDINGYTYVVAQTNSDIPGLDPNRGGYDVLVFKLDPSGQTVWLKTFGGSDDDIPTDVLIHPDGNIYVAVQSLSNDGDFNASKGLNDLWIMKLSAQNANVIYNKQYGGTGNDFNAVMDAFGDDHLVVSSSSTSIDGDLTGNKGLSDNWIFVTDLDGQLIQQMNYGGSVNDFAADILVKDSIFYVLSNTLSNDKNVPVNSISQTDMWYYLLNTDPAACSNQLTCLTDSIPTNVLFPPDNNSLICVKGCNAGLNPGPHFGGGACPDFTTPTAYYKIFTDTLADLLTISVNSFEMNRPRIAIFKTVNCNTYQQVQCATGEFGSVILSFLEVVPRTTYVIAITDDEGNIGEFEFCASSIHVSFCNDGDVIYVTNTSMGSPPTGPFKPGERVSFCYELYDWNKLQCNGIQGFVPTFGPGWDSTYFDLFGQPLQVDSVIIPVVDGFWQWYGVGEVHYNISNPVNGYEGGQGMPAGWYFTNTGNSPPAENPDQTTGDINNCLPTPFDRWKVCFTLQVVDECESNLDCSVIMKTFADGEIGRNANLACVYDQEEIFSAYMLCCINPSIDNIQNFAICSGDTILFMPETNVPPPVTYTWAVDADSYVVGESSGTHLPTFYQVLTNTAVIPRFARYAIKADGGGCSTPLDEFTVEIRPNPKATLSLVGPGTVCSGSTITLSFTFTGDPPFAVGLYQNNQFFANVLSETNALSIDVDPVFSSNFTIGTLQDNNCAGNGTGSVNVTVLPLQTSIIDTAICLGDSIIVGGTAYDQAGFYTLTLEDQGSNGCDSSIQLTLSVIQPTHETINEVICRGDTLFVLGLPFTETTSKLIEFQSPEGCTNTIQLDLLVKDTFYMDLQQTICFGDTIEFEGIEVFEDGTYSHTEEVRPMCFETTVLQLDVLPQIVINDLNIQPDDGNENGAILVEFAGGSPPYSFQWNTGATTESLFNIQDGNYRVTLTDNNGCTTIFDFYVPFYDATTDPVNAALHCWPSLLNRDQAIQLVNTSNELVNIERLDISNLSGVKLIALADLQIQGGSIYALPVSGQLVPGMYYLTAQTDAKQQYKFRIVIQ